MKHSAGRARRRRSSRCRSRCGRSRAAESTDTGLDPARATEIERVFRAEYGRAVAVLVRVFGDIGVAEDAVADAFTAAVERWPGDGMPPSPAGWTFMNARRRGIKRVARGASR